MDSYLDEKGQRNLGTYLNHIGEILGNDGRRASFALYAIWGSLAKESARAWSPSWRTCPTPLDMERAQDRVLHFLVDPELLRLLVAERARHFPPCAARTQPAQAAAQPLAPERHFPDSLYSVRLAIGRAISRWVPRCPTCHAPRNSPDAPSGERAGRGLTGPPPPPLLADAIPSREDVTQ